MAYNWLKWFHGAVTDDKWPLIARKSGQPVAVAERRIARARPEGPQPLSLLGG